MPIWMVPLAMDVTMRRSSSARADLPFLVSHVNCAIWGFCACAAGGDRGAVDEEPVTGPPIRTATAWPASIAFAIRVRPTGHLARGRRASTSTACPTSFSPSMIDHARTHSPRYADLLCTLVARCACLGLRQLAVPMLPRVRRASRHPSCRSPLDWNGGSASAGNVLAMS